MKNQSRFAVCGRGFSPSGRGRLSHETGERRRMRVGSVASKLGVEAYTAFSLTELRRIILYDSVCQPCIIIIHTVNRGVR